MTAVAGLPATAVSHKSSACLTLVLFVLLAAVQNANPTPNRKLTNPTSTT